MSDSLSHLESTRWTKSGRRFFHLRKDLQRIGAEGQGLRIIEDLGGTSHTGRLNRKLQGQVPGIGRVGRSDPWNKIQDIFQPDVECRFRSQASQK